MRLDDGAMACLPEEESIPGKKYSQGERVCALVLDVEDRTWAADRRAPVIVSTAIAGLLAEVLAAEVPEVARGDVVIKSVARVSGKMSKVAVARREGVEKVFDPVLACVGVENSRLRAIVSDWVARFARFSPGPTTARTWSPRLSSPRPCTGW